MNLAFVEATHTYTIDGGKVPSVTQVIAACVPTFQAGQWYLDRGRAVHSAIQLHLQGQLDWSSIDDRIKGRMKGFLAFMDDTGTVPLAVELRQASEAYRFAGTIDMLGEIRKQSPFLVDWKSTLCPEVEVQLGAYWLLLPKTSTVDRAVAVETHDKGSYQCKWFSARELRAASQTFLAMLTTRNWLEKNHKLKN